MNRDEWFWCPSDEGKRVGWREIVDLVVMSVLCAVAGFVVGALPWVLM